MLATYPAHAPRYRRLCRAVLKVRQRRSLPSVEQHVENRILYMLRDGARLNDDVPPVIFPGMRHPATCRCFKCRSGPTRSCVKRRAAKRRRPARSRWRQSGRAGDDAPCGDTRGTAPVRAEPVHPQPLRKDPRHGRNGSMSIVRRTTAMTTTPAAADELDDMTLGERNGRPAARFRFDSTFPGSAGPPRRLWRKSPIPNGTIGAALP